MIDGIYDSPFEIPVIPSAIAHPPRPPALLEGPRSAHGHILKVVQRAVWPRGTFCGSTLPLPTERPTVPQIPEGHRVRLGRLGDEIIYIYIMEIDGMEELLLASMHAY